MEHMQSILSLVSIVVVVIGFGIAYGTLKTKVANLMHEVEVNAIAIKENAATIKEMDRVISEHKIMSANTYVTQDQIRTIDKRLQKTEDRFVGELRHLRDTVMGILRPQ